MKTRTLRAVALVIASIAALIAPPAAHVGALEISSSVEVTETRLNHITVAVPAATPDGVVVSSLVVGREYELEVSGTVGFAAASGSTADAECSVYGGHADNGARWLADRWNATFGLDGVELKTKSASGQLGDLALTPVDSYPHASEEGQTDCSTTHTYLAKFTPTSTSQRFVVHDASDGYWDNSGALTLSLRRDDLQPGDVAIIGARTHVVCGDGRNCSDLRMTAYWQTPTGLHSSSGNGTLDQFGWLYAVVLAGEVAVPTFDYYVVVEMDETVVVPGVPLPTSSAQSQQTTPPVLIDTRWPSAGFTQTPVTHATTATVSTAAAKSGTQLTVTTKSTAPTTGTRVVLVDPDGATQDLTVGTTSAGVTSWSGTVTAPAGPDGRQLLTTCVVSNTYAGACSSAPTWALLSPLVTTEYQLDNSGPVIDPESVVPGDNSNIADLTTPIAANLWDVGAEVTPASITFHLIDETAGTTTTHGTATPGYDADTAYAATAPVTLTVGHVYRTKVVATDTLGNTTTYEHSPADRRGGFRATTFDPAVTTATIDRTPCEITPLPATDGTKTVTCRNVNVNIAASQLSMAAGSHHDRTAPIRQEYDLFEASLVHSIAPGVEETLDAPAAWGERQAWLGSSLYEAAGPVTFTTPAIVDTVDEVVATVPGYWTNASVLLPPTMTRPNWIRCPIPPQEQAQTLSMPRAWWCVPDTSTPPAPDRPPHASLSYYMHTDNPEVAYNMGLKLGMTAAANTEPARGAPAASRPVGPDYYVVLFFASWTSTGEFNLFDNPDNATPTEAKAAVSAFAQGFWGGVGNNTFPRLRVAVGMSNYGSNFGAASADALATIAKEVDDIWKDRQVRVSAAIDAELAWAEPARTRALFDAYDAKAGQLGSDRDVFNIGEASGCTTTGTSGTECGTADTDNDPDDDDWSANDVRWISSHGSTRRSPFPQIYRTDGTMARQWQRLSAGGTMYFKGALAQQQACVDVQGTPQECEPTMANPPAEAWRQLYTELYSEASTRQRYLTWSSNMAWQKNHSCTANYPAGDYRWDPAKC